METLAHDSLYMHRALDLAVLGRGSVSPNPLVGCVIVHEGRIIGEGYHQRYGEAHAEVNAINSVPSHWRHLLPEATLYCNLEPCSHFGKTPPCADFIIKHQIKRVVVASLDINPLVAGKGIQKLKNAGVAVSTDVLAPEGQNLNKRFFTFMKRLRPYLILKWAETADGFLARPNHDSRWISGALSRQLVHKWRAEEDAVLVGTNTAHYDNPRLSVRDWTGRNPLRLIIDRHLRLSPSLHLFDGSQPTLCYNSVRDGAQDNLEYVRVREGDFLINMMGNLHYRRVQSIMVEGGGQLLAALLAADLWDELRVFRAGTTFGAGIAAPRVRGKLHYQERIGPDDLFIFRREDAF
jgi:diaminohydroxyphosphoribosylaminopyrimidine deaminase / 5-amino-6-(5-phosphoribosylamino)uracil reductase